MSKILSRIASNGERVSCSEFCSTKHYHYADEAEKRFVASLPYTDLKDVPDIDNGEIYEWYEIGSGKYDRDMYCPKTKIKRSQTMGEFYRNSPVD